MDDLKLTSVTPETRTKKVNSPADIAMRARLIDASVFVLLVTLSLSVYLRTLCPTIFSDDCGEITTAVATGGVVHPPGYPLYTLLGQLFIALFDTGEPAWRLGLLSSVCGCLTVGVTYLLARRLGAGAIWSATASIAFAFSVTLWQQSTKVETYTLNSLLIGLVWLFASRYDDVPTLKRLCQFALCAGLALTNHLTSVCAIAGALVVVVMTLRRSQKSPILSVIASVFMMVAPLSLYATLWFNAQSHPGGQVWGNPSNWRGLELQLTGARYHPYFSSQNGLEMAQRDLVNLPAILWHNLGPILVFVVPGAARALWVDGPQRRLTLALLIAISAYLIETTVYGILNIFEYYTPVVMILSIFAGVGGESVLKGLKNLRVFKFFPAERALSAICLAVTLTSAVIVHWSYCDRSNATFIRDMALNTLNSLPKNSVVIATGDNRVFPMWYAQDVLGVRCDVTVVPRHAMDTLSGRDGVLMMSWLVNKLGDAHPDVVPAKAILHRAETDPNYARNEGPTWDIAVQALSQNEPVFMSDPQAQDTHLSFDQTNVLNPIGPNLVLSPYGLVDQIVPQKSYTDVRIRSSVNLALLSKMSMDLAPDALMQDEPDGNITNLAYAAMLSRDSDLAVRAGQYDDAYRLISEAIQYQHTAYNYDMLAWVCTRSMRPLEAIRDYQIAIRLDPENEDYKDQLKSAQEMLHVVNRASLPVSNDRNDQ